MPVMMEDLMLRDVETSDVPFLQAVYASTRAEELAQTTWSAEQKAAFCQSQFAAQDKHYRTYYPAAKFFIIERACTAIGRLYVDRGEREIRIMEISLLPQFRGAGTGTYLLKELQAEARQAGKALSIHVEKFNPALRLYERLGFSVLEDKGVYLLMEWRG